LSIVGLLRFAIAAISFKGEEKRKGEIILIKDYGTLIKNNMCTDKSFMIHTVIHKKNKKQELSILI